MEKCPVCQQPVEATVCGHCGFDGSQDYEQFVTFVPIAAGIRSAAARRRARKRRSSDRTCCGSCGENSYALDAEGVLRCTGCGTEFSDAQVLALLQSPRFREASREVREDAVNFDIRGHVLVKYTGSSPVPVIPDRVTEIGEKAFENNSHIRSLLLPPGVRTIGDRAFWHCTELETVELPDSITEIAGCAFGGCEKLRQIRIPQGIGTLSAGVFYNCDSLTEVRIPGTVTTIGASAFMFCRKLERVILEPGVRTIQTYAFYGCRSLTDITIPDSVDSVVPAAFDSSGLQKLHASEQWKRDNARTVGRIRKLTVRKA